MHTAFDLDTVLDVPASGRQPRGVVETDLASLCAPYSVVTVSRTDKRVSDLVKDRAHDLFVTTIPDVVFRDTDELLAVNAAA